MTIQNFNSANLKSVRLSLEEALKLVEKEFSIKLEIGNISYENDTFTTRLSAKVKSADANLFSVHGLPNLTNVGFKYNGKHYKIIGFNASKKRFPITTVDILSGSVQNFTIECVKSIIKF